MNHLYQSAFMEALGWTLVDSFWKMGSLWIAYIIITGNGKWFSAATRYLLAITLMSAGTLWSFASLGRYYHEILHGQGAPGFALYFNKNIAGAYATLFMPFIALAYMVMLAFFSGRLLYQYHAGRPLLRELIAVDDRLCEVLDRVVKTIRLKRRVRIFMSAAARAPLTIGIFRPVVLLPIAMLNQLSLEQASAVIAHELFHIRRHDYLINILMSASGVLFFFNPFARLFENTIRKEREHVCDDEVMALGFDSWQYAHALYLLGRHASAPATFALAATGHKPLLLLDRIRRILKSPPAKRTPRVASGLGKSMALFFLCLGISVFLKRPQNTALATTVTPAVKPVPTSLAVDVPPTIHFSVVHKAPAVRQKMASQPTRTLIAKSRKQPLGEPLATSKGTPGVPTEPPAPPVPYIPSGMANVFVSRAESPSEFSLNIPRPPAPPIAKAELDASSPYVPSATFYYSIIEDSLSASGRTIIHL